MAMAMTLTPGGSGLFTFITLSSIYSLRSTQGLQYKSDTTVLSLEVILTGLRKA